MTMMSDNKPTYYIQSTNIICDGDENDFGSN